jgi:protein-S-isoprenylcysteine O-methyltransferase Ste14
MSNSAARPSTSLETGAKLEAGANPTSAQILDDAELRRVQRRRKQTIRLGAVFLLGMVALCQSMAPRESQLHDTIEAIGLMAIGLCIFGRGWCSLYIGGRKKTELVTTGPYSMCRNPLYVFSFIGAFGVGAQTGSVVIAFVFAIVCWWVFRSVVLREEAVLADRFGVAFKRYKNVMPRFRPTWYRWRDEDALVCRPALFLTTTRDALWFLIAGPVFEGVKLMQAQGWIIPILTLP